MSPYMRPVFEGVVESWGQPEIRLEVGFCHLCSHPLASGVCSFCGWTRCPLCGAHEDCEHLLPCIECHTASLPGHLDPDEDEDDDEYEDDDVLGDEEPRGPVAPFSRHWSVTVHPVVEQAERAQPRPSGLTFDRLHDLVRSHGNWMFGVADPLRDERVLYELVHDPRLASRLEEEIWTRAAREARTALVAVERIPVGGRCPQSPRYRRWYAPEGDAVLAAGEELEEEWSRRIEDVGESVRAHVGELVCPMCDEPTFATVADKLYSCSYCGAYECPFDGCGLDSVECGIGCAHSLGPVVEGGLFHRRIDLSDPPMSKCDPDRLDGLDDATLREIFGDLYPVLVEAYENGVDRPPREAFLLLELGRHACPDVRVEDYNGFSIPLARDLELAREQYRSALVRLSECFAVLDRTAPAWKNVSEEDRHGEDS